MLYLLSYQIMQHAPLYNKYLAYYIFIL